MKPSSKRERRFNKLVLFGSIAVIIHSIYSLFTSSAYLTANENVGFLILSSILFLGSAGLVLTDEIDERRQD